MSVERQIAQKPTVPAPAPRAGFEGLQRKCACGGSAGLDAECEECKQKEISLQRRASCGGPATAPPIVHEVLRSPGQPLDPATRAFMEPRFGHDFSKVRVHAGAEAAASARAVNALAYTVGKDVVFGAGQYAPGTGAGRQLLAHELSHVIQQSGQSQAGPGQTQAKLAVSQPGDVYEQEADRVADRILQMPSAAQGVQRELVGHRISGLIQRDSRCHPPTEETVPIGRITDFKSADPASVGNDGFRQMQALVPKVKEERAKGNTVELHGFGRHGCSRAWSIASFFEKDAKVKGPFGLVEDAPTELGASAADNQLVIVSVVSSRKPTAPVPAPAEQEDDPISLKGSFDPSTKTYDQLSKELGKIQRWLESHPGSSADRTQLESVQTQIVATMKRLDKAMGRPSPIGVVDVRPFSKSPQQVEETEKLGEKLRSGGISAPAQTSAGPPRQPAKTESALEKFTREHAKEIAQLPQWNEHFVQGLLRSPLREKLGEAWEQLKSDLTSVKRGAAFYLGLTLGVPIGAVKDLYDQVEAVVELAIKALLFKIRLEMDPLKVWSELKKFADSLPGMLLQLFDAEALGLAAGQALAAKVDQEFVKKGPMDQGQVIGEIIGAILMEIALLFVGVEEVTAAIKAVRAGVLGEEVAHGMAVASRELRAVLEAEKVLKTEAELAEEARALGKAGKETTKLEKEGSEAASKIAKLPKDLASCRLGSLSCPIDGLLLKPEFQKHLRARPHEEFLGPLNRNLDLEIGKSLRQTQTVLTGDAMRARYLSEVHFTEWPHPFLEEMSRIEKLPASLEGTGFIEVDVKGVKRRWPVDNVGRPWEVHHEPPLDCGGTDASNFLRPVPFNVHADATKWWNGFKRLALEKFSVEERRLITSSEELHALGL